MSTYGSGGYGDGPYGPSMMLTYDSTLSRVRVAADSLATGAASMLVERSTDQVRWVAVRGGTAVNPTASVDDYEFAADVANWYRITVYDSDGDQIDQVSASITPDLGGQVWLKSVARPYLNRPVTVLDFSDVTRPSRGTSFDVIGAQDPVAVTDVRGSKQWTLTVPIPITAATFGTEADATTLTDSTLDAILTAGDIMLVQVPAGSQVPGGYVLIGDVTRSRKYVHPKYVYWDLPCKNVAAPGPDVVGATSTWQTVLNTYATWGDLLAAQSTWGDLLELIGDPSEVTS